MTISMAQAVRCLRQIAGNLAMGHTMQESVENAKRYITGALQAGLNLGKGSGPLEHTYWLEIQGRKIRVISG